MSGLNNKFYDESQSVYMYDSKSGIIRGSGGRRRFNTEKKTSLFGSDDNFTSSLPSSRTPKSSRPLVSQKSQKPVVELFPPVDPNDMPYTPHHEAYLDNQFREMRMEDLGLESRGKITVPNFTNMIKETPSNQETMEGRNQVECNGDYWRRPSEEDAEEQEDAIDSKTIPSYRSDYSIPQQNDQQDFSQFNNFNNSNNNSNNFNKSSEPDPCNNRHRIHRQTDPMGLLPLPGDNGGTTASPSSFEKDTSLDSPVSPLDLKFGKHGIRKYDVRRSDPFNVCHAQERNSTAVETANRNRIQRPHLYQQTDPMGLKPLDQLMLQSPSVTKALNTYEEYKRSHPMDRLTLNTGNNSNNNNNQQRINSSKRASGHICRPPYAVDN